MEKSILTKQQNIFLDLFSQDRFLSGGFYLTGGTALAGFYLFHRYSEDLDFFSEKEFDVSAINIFLAKVKTKAGITKIDYEQSYNRHLFFCHFGAEALKTEFTFFPFPRIKKQKPKEGIFIDSLLDIGVNKLFSVYQRSVARDYIDLYFIRQEKGWTIKELVAKAKVKFDWHIDPLQLGAQFVKANEATDLPRMIKKVNPSEWRKFFIDEAKKLEPDILDM